MKFLFFLSLFIFFVSLTAEEAKTLNKSQIKELTLKMIKSIHSNENVIIDERLDHNITELDLSINTFRAKFHKIIEGEIKLKVFDEISLFDQVLIYRALLINPKKTILLIFTFYKYKDSYILSSFQSNSNTQNAFVKSTSVYYKFDKDYVVPNKLINRLQNINDETIKKLLSGDEKISQTEIINENANQNVNIEVTFIGGLNITDNLGTCYYLISTKQNYVILNLTHTCFNNKTEFIGYSASNSPILLSEVFNSFAR